MTNNETPAQRLQRFIDEDNLIRHAWTEGQHRACLLAAMSPECGEAHKASACPAEIMPQWLAHLTPKMDDLGTEEAWPAMVRRYAAAAARWDVLDAAAWERVHTEVCCFFVKEARNYVPEQQQTSRYVELLDRALTALRGSTLERDDIRRDLEDHKYTLAGGRAIDAIIAAGWVLQPGASHVMYAAKYIAFAAGVYQARCLAWDRMSDGILAAIEAECAAT